MPAMVVVERQSLAGDDLPVGMIYKLGDVDGLRKKGEVEKENGVRSNDDGVENESEKDDVHKSKARRDYGKV
ncbi:hypothetical protein Tco_1033299 [Tanacetum coccineum]|uniref:Uncharacterized protein n=1 Tax=Tanacetum coccineum TaxID=301880 RepID=A0ABQ5GF85_9ASTR